MISNILLKSNMDPYCDVCDKTIKSRSKNKPSKALTHEIMKNLIKKITILKIQISLTYIMYLSKISPTKIRKFEFYLNRVVFELGFDNDLDAHIKSDFHYNISPIELKRYLLYWLDSFILSGYKISHFSEMNIETILIKEI